MALIARLALETRVPGPLGWACIAGSIQRWLSDRDVALRDAVVLLPAVTQLPHARRSWAAQPGWSPRIETPQSLALTLGPPPPVVDGQLSFDPSTDRLHVARLLRSRGVARSDPLAFDDAVSAVMRTAHALARAAAAVPPAQRAAHWQKGRQLLAVQDGPDRLERELAGHALEWAAQAGPLLTDVLFDCRPGAWVVVQAGGADPLMQALLAQAPDDIPCALADTDEPALHRLPESITLSACDGFEDEAQRVAAQVLSELKQGRAPVALVAQDRLLVRRVRALLERQRVPLVDETGWKLSTTHAAAQLMCLLRAAGPMASTDMLLDWLKARGFGPDDAELESAFRREGWARVASVDAGRLPARAAAAWAAAQAVLEPLRSAPRTSLGSWADTLKSALQLSRQWARLEADEAGIQTLRALHLNTGSHLGLAGQTLMTLDDFSAWVDATLEDATFIPTAPAAAAGVVITPLSRLALRPFAAVVFPGADERHLGVPGELQPLLSDAQAQALGVPTSAQRREAEAIAFAHAVGMGPVSLFHRRSDGAEPLSTSPLVEQLALRLRRAGLDFRPWGDPRHALSLAVQLAGMPSPAAADRLPARLSASACEALRACPYRFYALHLLRLREADELGDEVEKRDYGTWLHAVLHRFHETRNQPSSAETETARLLELGREQQATMRLDDADFLPFDVAFSDLAPRYIAWLHERDRSGARWWQGEQSREREPEGWQGIRLQGRIDRADRASADPAAAIELIDYKTGSAEALRQQVRQPLEDTQLAVYAALMASDVQAAELRAMYLSLGREIKPVEHPDVLRSAEALLEGLGGELARIRQGHGLPALGEGRVCETCEARGLCRRDQWAQVPP